MSIGARRGVMAAGGAGGLLLDLYPGASFAISLRKLSSFATSAIRVRRGSDSAELDIGFVGNDLDAASLLAFCGGGDGFVTKWYDQSGNGRDAVNFTAAQQESVVTSGVVETSGSKPAVAGLAKTFGYNTGFTGLSEKSVFAVADTSTGISATLSARVITSYSGSSSVNNEYVLDHQRDTNTLRYLDGGTSIVIPGHPPGYYLLYTSKDAGGGMGLGVNGASLVTTSGNTNANTLPYKAMEEGGTNDPGISEVPKYMQEAIMYPSEMDTERSAIEDNINGYYGVY